MLDWFIAVVTILIISGTDMFLFGHDSWSMWESFTATALFAIFLKLKD